MTYIEAPTEFIGEGMTLFLAGGISDCENWQAQMIELLRETDLVLLNPRRRSFDMLDPAAGEMQIEWEFRHLVRASAALFWFPPQTLCPIALYELGRWTATGRPAFVGCDPKYARARDVTIQMKHARPRVRVAGSLVGLAQQVIGQTMRMGKDVA